MIVHDVATCSVCGHRWDSMDPGVRYWYGFGTWECTDEAACFERAAERFTSAAKEGE